MYSSGNMRETEHLSKVAVSSIVECIIEFITVFIIGILFIFGILPMLFVE